jgi:chromosome segregation protein
LNQVNIELAKHSIRIEDLQKEILEENLEVSKIKESAQSLEGMSEEEAHQQIHEFKKQLEIIGGIDDETVAEYNEINERYTFLTEQVDDMEKAIVAMEKVIEELDVTIKKQFDEAFKEINREFQKYFGMLFSGGKAELMKVQADDDMPRDAAADADKAEKDTAVSRISKIAKRIKQREKDSYSGIEIKAEPPGKKISSINMLSGGERALTSIALISAILSNNNSPFVMLDEMDAALDESNALRFGAILKELSEKTQFIVITHTRATMSESQLLYGVTMGDDGVSKLLSIELKDAEEMDVVRH